MNEREETELVSSKKANDAGWTVAVCMLLGFIVVICVLGA